MSKNNTNNELNLSKEISELREVVAELIKAYSQNVEDKLHKVPDYIREESEEIAESLKEHPLKSVGIAALVGFVLGAVLSRK